MKYLLPLILTCGLANADQEPEQVYLYTLMNGDRHKIQVFKTEYDTLEECEYAIRLSKQGGHTKAVMYCGTNIDILYKNLSRIKHPQR